MQPHTSASSSKLATLRRVEARLLPGLARHVSAKDQKASGRDEPGEELIQLRFARTLIGIAEAPPSRNIENHL